MRSSIIPAKTVVKIIKQLNETGFHPIVSERLPQHVVYIVAASAL